MSERRSHKEGKNRESRRTGGNNPKETHFHILGTGVTQVETPLPTFVFICPPVLLPSRHSKGKSLFWFRVAAILPWTPGLLSAHAIPCGPTISLACITCPWPPQRRRGAAVPALPKSTLSPPLPVRPLFFSDDKPSIFLFELFPLSAIRIYMVEVLIRRRPVHLHATAERSERSCLAQSQNEVMTSRLIEPYLHLSVFQMQNQPSNRRAGGHTTTNTSVSKHQQDVDDSFEHSLQKEMLIRVI